MEIKQRHTTPKEQRINGNVSDTKKVEETSGMFRKGIFVAVVLLVFSSCLVLYGGIIPRKQHYHAVTLIDKVSLAVGLQERVHAVMFDAGSTGSRIFVFTFHRDTTGGLKLLSEFFKEVKPGLSYYASNPSQAAASLQPLLNHAKEEIPESEWGNTPLLLKATAGLRLLPGDKAQAILNEVETLFQKSPFQINKNSVSIMEGSDEGLFSWFTVNFLLDKLDDMKTSVANFDLGGGSTQITFSPNNESTVKFAPKGHIHKINMMDTTVKFYVHSYLGLGLMTARLSILKSGNKLQDSKTQEISTPCFPPSITKKWEYTGVTYNIRSTETPKEGRFEECYKIAQTVVNSKVYHPPELQERTIYAISYYYDRAAENGLIDEQEGGKITVGDYFTAGRKVCQKGDPKQPFACLDLAYISALLHEGLGLPEHKEIMLKKKIEGHETSWALGAAFSVIAKWNI